MTPCQLVKLLKRLGKNHFIAIANVKITLGSKAARSPNNRIAQLDHLLNSGKTGAMIAGDFLKIILTHAFNDMLAFGIQGAKRSNVYCRPSPG